MAAFLPCKLVQDHAAFLPSYARMTVRKPIWACTRMSEEMPCPIHPSQRWKVCLTKTGPPRCSLARWVLICGCSKEVVRRPDPPSVGKPVRFRPPVQEIKEGKK